MKIISDTLLRLVTKRVIIGFKSDEKLLENVFQQTANILGTFLNSRAFQTALEKLIKFRFANFITSLKPLNFWIQESTEALLKLRIVPVYHAIFNGMVGLDSEIYISVDYLESRIFKGNFRKLKGFNVDRMKIARAYQAIILRIIIHEGANLLTRQVFYGSFLGASPITSVIKNIPCLNTGIEPFTGVQDDEDDVVELLLMNTEAKPTEEESQISEKGVSSEEEEKKSEETEAQVLDSSFWKLDSGFLLEYFLFGSYYRQVETHLSFLDKTIWENECPIFNEKELKVLDRRTFGNPFFSGLWIEDGKQDQKDEPEIEF